MRKRNSLPLLLLGLASLSIPSAPAQEGGTVPCNLQRFACRKQAYTNYATVQGLPGFGPKNVSVFASIDPRNSNEKERQAGYVITPIELGPPGQGGGFQDMSAKIKVGTFADMIADGRVEFTFQFSEGPPLVLTKKFTEMNPRPEGANTQTISASNEDFGQIFVGSANLTRLVIYIKQNTKQTNYFLGKCTVNSGQGKYKVTNILMDQAGC
ncbi:MAG: hypothetical protein K2Z81_09390, partial [Cyanobacteria bacterium]|nr:hypothetical protein [Cyanobacteriota bacterium]